MRGGGSAWVRESDCEGVIEGVQKGGELGEREKDRKKIEWKAHGGGGHGCKYVVDTPL